MLRDSKRFVCNRFCSSVTLRKRTESRLKADWKLAEADWKLAEANRKLAEGDR